MVRTINVTLTMSVSDANGEPLSDASAKDMAERTEEAIRERLMGEGYLPDENMGVDNYGFSSTFEG